MPTNAPEAEDHRRVVTASSLRMRSSPELNESNTIALLPRGTVVEVKAPVASVWAFVTAGSRLGWVAAKYLAELDSPAVPSKRGLEEFAWMPIALRELGQSEVAGSATNPRITEYQRASELDGDRRPSDETPWCSDFACWCVESAGFESTNSAAARSWLAWGRAISQPRRGVIVVLSRVASGNPNGGHVGFFISRKEKKTITLLGGNQGNRVSFAEYDASRVLGFRIP